MEEKNDAVITVSDMPEIKEAEDAFCNITLIQWNLHIGIDMTGRYNLKRQAEVLNELDADVIALNEVDRNCIRTGFSDMTKELGILTGMMFTQFCAARVLPPDGLYGNAVLSRYKMDLIGAELIPATKDESRGMTLVKIHAPNPFYLALTHLNFRDTPEENLIRTEAVQKIDELIHKYCPEDFPAILVGDFNCLPESDPVNKLMELGWNAEKMLPTFPSPSPVASIGHIFNKNHRIEVWDRIPVDERIASDHIPVVNKLKIYHHKRER